MKKQHVLLFPLAVLMVGASFTYRRVSTKGQFLGIANSTVLMVRPLSEQRQSGGSVVAKDSDAVITRPCNLRCFW